MGEREDERGRHVERGKKWREGDDWGALLGLIFYFFCKKRLFHYHSVIPFQAGAKHVYAVEASEMAEYARKLIAGNPTLAQRITVRSVS